MNTFNTVLDWVTSIVGDPPGPISNGTYSLTWSPTELVAYFSACLVTVIVVKLITSVIRSLFIGG